MIKILKEGRIPEDIVRHFLCHRCLTIFDASSSDYKEVRSGPFSTMPICTCPLCGIEVYGRKEPYEIEDN